MGSKQNNKGLFVFIILLLLIFIQCERTEPSWEPFDCSTCYQDEPMWGPLQISVTINEQNQFVQLVIYKGDIEDNDIEYSDIARNSNYTIDVPVGKYYSVTAEYKDGNNVIIVVDGDNLKIKKNSTDCDEECYYFKGGYIDVRLRD